MSWLRPLRTWRTRPLRFFALAFLLALILAGGERLAGELRTRYALPTRGTCWIWATGNYGLGEPIAFYAVRELELEQVPPATIAIAADETYLLYVNGRRIGAGSYRPGAPVDEYAISDWLEPGINRILIELRSSRGAGGLLAEIDLGGEGGSPARSVVTDGEWRIFRRYDSGLFGGWSHLDGGEAPEIWQCAPTGRWRLGGSRIRRPTPQEGYLPPVRRRPVRFQQQHGETWHELTWTRNRMPALGQQQIFDWGEEVEGILSFDLASDQGEPGLFYVGLEPPDPADRPPDGVLLPVPGRRHWEDAHARRFRYLLLVGAEPYSRIAVERVEPSAADELAGLPNGGVFGLAPPRSYSKVEEDVWGSLERRVRDQQEQRRVERAAKQGSRR